MRNFPEALGWLPFQIWSNITSAQFRVNPGKDMATDRCVAASHCCIAVNDKGQDVAENQLEFLRILTIYYSMHP